MELEPERRSKPAVVQGALARAVTDGLIVLEQARLEPNIRAQSREHGFGGRVYLDDGQVLDFNDAPPSTSHDELSREAWYTKGFTDSDIDSGVSTLITESGDNGAITGRVFIAGLLDPQPGVRVVRQQQDGSYAPSELSAVEKSAIVRLAFLSQLIGYISDRYSKQTPYRAVNAFIEELENDRGMEGSLLRNMFHAHPLPGMRPNQLTTPTIVEGLTRFDDLIGSYRWRLNPANTALHAGPTYEASRLVESGDYFTRILASLDLAQSELGDGIVTPPPAIEAR